MQPISVTAISAIAVLFHIMVACDPEVCDDGIDNDGDGLMDCADYKCVCDEDCDNGVDDDGNGDTDCEDVWCEDDPACDPDLDTDTDTE